MKQRTSKRKKYASHRCVSCGRRIELAESGLPNHRCSKRHVAAREAENRRELEINPFPDLSFDQRLSLGFSMLDDWPSW